ncbi:MAG: hypothetical protein H5U40_11520 [Polyangiaceae bacterium]|nr:hypothetical protein [Polyangiaceae bacterium]
MMRRALAVAFVLAAGCAPAHPAFVGGSTTPARRADLGLGGAARIATGDLRNADFDAADASRYRESAEGSGVVPAAFGRYGLERGFEVGLLAAGTLLRLDFRREHVIDHGSTRPAFIYGLAPYAGYVKGSEGGDGQGHRLGLELPLAYAVEFGGIYEFWVGGRGAIERVHGEFLHVAGAREDATGIGVRGGAVLGLGLGFRRVHALVELTGGYERWWVEHGDESLDRGGFVLTPAFALRFRI